MFTCKHSHNNHLLTDEIDIYTTIQKCGVGKIFQMCLKEFSYMNVFDNNL